MKWLKIKIKTHTTVTEMIVMTLAEIGFEGAQIEDNQPISAADLERMFADIVPDMPDDDGVAYVSVFAVITDSGKAELLGTELDVSILVEQIEAKLAELSAFIDIGGGDIIVSETADIDWRDNWKSYFTPFAVDDILIVPSWEESIPTEAATHVLRIDPGAVFGTGQHETTKICIRELRKHLRRGDHVLDIGCGSGILSITALLLGADYVLAVDIDEHAAEAVQHNSKANAIASEKLDVVIGNILVADESCLIAKEKQFDIVVANIITGTLVELTAIVHEYMKNGAVFITSGIINDELQVEQVLIAMKAAGMTIVDVVRDSDWVGVTARGG
ncbi:MAG: 50S ribosomal protein L11 methyltransferase [Lachnospiraceae bacterium]|jgi:ribosomal protein L11 methyltransferase|nr:50S ribosomal protein L11 methyltransferase [Lachnospiraceae bacterium]